MPRTLEKYNVREACACITRVISFHHTNGATMRDHTQGEGIQMIQFPGTIEPQRATAAQSAALMKATLRKAFPAVKFSVRLSRGTGYGNCYVQWTDGPTRDRVNAIIAQFEGASFDGSTDSMNYRTTVMVDGRVSGLRLILPERRISAAFARTIAAAVSAWWGGDDMQAPAIIEGGGYWNVDTSRDNAARARTGSDWAELIYRASGNRLTVTRALGGAA